MSDWLRPEEYVKTIESSSLYACLLFTDSHERLFMLHSSRPEHGQQWQLPGGNVEKKQTPWDTARRECFEETGWEFTGPPVLLGAHYLTPRPTWPVGKIGLIFDGGVLSAEQLAAVRVDPREHTHSEVHTLEEWRDVLSPARSAGVSRWLQARQTGAAQYLCDDDLATVPTGSAQRSTPGVEL